MVVEKIVTNLNAKFNNNRWRNEEALGLTSACGPVSVPSYTLSTGSLESNYYRQ